MIARATWASRRTYSWTSRTADFDHSWIFAATLAPAPGQTQLAAFQLLDAVAQRGRLLELEVVRGALHLHLQAGDVGVKLSLRLEHPRLVRRGPDGHVITLVDAAHHLVDALHDRRRRDAVFGVVRSEEHTSELQSREN